MDPNKSIAYIASLVKARKLDEAFNAWKDLDRWLWSRLKAGKVVSKEIYESCREAKKSIDRALKN